MAAGPALSVTPAAGTHGILLPNYGSAGCKVLIVHGGGNATTQIFDPATATLSAGPTLSGNVGAGGLSIAITSGPNAGKVVILHGANGQASTVLDLTAMSVSSGNATMANIGGDDHYIQIPSGPQSGNYLIWTGGGSMNTVVLNPSTLIFSVGPVDTQITAPGSRSFRVSGGVRDGQFYKSRGGISNIASVYRPASHDFDPGVISSFTACTPGAGSSIFTVSGGALNGQPFIICAGGTNTNVYSSGSDTFASGNPVSAAVGLGASSFLIPTGPQAGNTLVILGGGATTATSMFTPGTAAFSVGTVNTAANVGASGFSVLTP